MIWAMIEITTVRIEAAEVWFGLEDRLEEQVPAGTGRWLRAEQPARLRGEDDEHPDRKRGPGSFGSYHGSRRRASHGLDRRFEGVATASLLTRCRRRRP